MTGLRPLTVYGPEIRATNSAPTSPLNEGGSGEEDGDLIASCMSV